MHNNIPPTPMTTDFLMNDNKDYHIDDIDNDSYVKTIFEVRVPKEYVAFRTTCPLKAGATISPAVNIKSELHCVAWWRHQMETFSA